MPPGRGPVTRSRSVGATGRNGGTGKGKRRSSERHKRRSGRKSRDKRELDMRDPLQNFVPSPDSDVEMEVSGEVDESEEEEIVEKADEEVLEKSASEEEEASEREEEEESNNVAKEERGSDDDENVGNEEEIEEEIENESGDEDEDKDEEDRESQDVKGIEAREADEDEDKDEEESDLGEDDEKVEFGVEEEELKESSDKAEDNDEEGAEDKAGNTPAAPLIEISSSEESDSDSTSSVLASSEGTYSPAPARNFSNPKSPHIPSPRPTVTSLVSLSLTNTSPARGPIRTFSTPPRRSPSPLPPQPPIVLQSPYPPRSNPDRYWEDIEVGTAGSVRARKSTNRASSGSGSDDSGEGREKGGVKRGDRTEEKSGSGNRSGSGEKSGHKRPRSEDAPLSSKGSRTRSGTSAEHLRGILASENSPRSPPPPLVAGAVMTTKSPHTPVSGGGSVPSISPAQPGAAFGARSRVNALPRMNHWGAPPTALVSPERLTTTVRPGVVSRSPMAGGAAWRSPRGERSEKRKRRKGPEGKWVFGDDSEDENEIDEDEEAHEDIANHQMLDEPPISDRDDDNLLGNGSTDEPHQGGAEVEEIEEVDEEAQEEIIRNLAREVAAISRRDDENEEEQEDLIGDEEEEVENETSKQVQGESSNTIIQKPLILSGRDDEQEETGEVEGVIDDEEDEQVQEEIIRRLIQEVRAAGGQVDEEEDFQPDAGHWIYPPGRYQATVQDERDEEQTSNQINQDAPSLSASRATSHHPSSILNTRSTDYPPYSNNFSTYRTTSNIHGIDDSEEEDEEDEEDEEPPSAQPPYSSLSIPYPNYSTQSLPQSGPIRPMRRHASAAAVAAAAAERKERERNYSSTARISARPNYEGYSTRSEAQDTQEEEEEYFNWLMSRHSRGEVLGSNSRTIYPLTRRRSAAGVTMTAALVGDDRPPVVAGVGEGEEEGGGGKEGEGNVRIENEEGELDGQINPWRFARPLTFEQRLNQGPQKPEVRAEERRRGVVKAKKGGVRTSSVMGANVIGGVGEATSAAVGITRGNMLPPSLPIAQLPPRHVDGEEGEGEVEEHDDDLDGYLDVQGRENGRHDRDGGEEGSLEAWESASAGASNLSRLNWRGRRRGGGSWTSRSRARGRWAPYGLPDPAGPEFPSRGMMLTEDERREVESRLDAREARRAKRRAEEEREREREKQLLSRGKDVKKSGRCAVM